MDSVHVTDKIVQTTGFSRVEMRMEMMYNIDFNQDLHGEDGKGMR